MGVQPLVRPRHQVPWDEQFVIESLSDSTIYMAYYTIAHFLQQGCGYNGKEGTGRGPMGIAPEDLNDGVWNYVFLKGEYPAGCAIAQENLDKMRASFEYWYPMNLRVSGKDLIKNHLNDVLLQPRRHMERSPRDVANIVLGKR